MPQKELRPVGTLVALQDPANPRVLLHYRVVGHLLGLDGATEEILMLLSTETRPREVGPTVHK